MLFVLVVKDNMFGRRSVEQKSVSEDTAKESRSTGANDHQDRSIWLNTPPVNVGEEKNTDLGARSLPARVVLGIIDKIAG